MYFRCFWLGSSHFLPFISRILVKIIITVKNLRHFWKKMVRIHISCGLRPKIMISRCFLRVSTQFLTYIIQILVKTIIGGMNLRYFERKNNPNSYFQQFKIRSTENEGSLLFFCRIQHNFYHILVKYDENYHFLHKPTLFPEKNYANQYFQQFENKEHRFSMFFGFYKLFFHILAKYW